LQGCANSSLTSPAWRRHHWEAADIHAPDGSIGTPVANVVGYGCWDVARLLVGRGADVDQPWVAAALGLLEHDARSGESDG
jgi:hypothetical protein